MSQSGPGSDKLNEIALQAERDLNTYQSKTGTGKGRASGLEDFGVNDTVDRKFPGADVKVGENLITNASYNRQIPADEGGDVDETGRFIRGSAYEGAGGPEDKTAHIYQHKPGSIDESTVKGWGKDPRELGTRQDRSDLLPSDQAVGGRGREPASQGDISEQGRLAAKSNVGLSADSRQEVPAQGSRGSQFKGEYYEAPESVQDQYADQGEIPPESVVERSKNI
ncbi:hypothetical protein C8A03DRAFT_18905 [Achaetomium macrosporum]|uniref:Uncharacterized protein n=1 Tax=Achaetomium macrosporum TaxID=79813 RepID=A0AAN7C324_9PEZI|nr:hypothetical protein C8A03DRAFT_18905 [Achaetomium macrosporum]